MNQPQQTQAQPTGIVGNTRAAGTRATEARAAVKAAWHKGPLFHLGVGIAAILGGIILNQSYDFNLFWSIVVWAGLVKLGKVLSGTKADSWHVWGKISRTAGWAVLLFTLANSGIRHFAEGSVNWLDQTLCNVWGSEQCKTVVGATASGGIFSPPEATLPIVQVGEVKTSPRLHVAGVYSMGEPRRQPGEYHVGCARVIEPAWVTNHPETPRWQLVNTTKQDSSWVDLRLTPEMQALLTQNGVSHVRLELTRVTTTYADTVNNLPCRHLRWNPDR